MSKRLLSLLLASLAVLLGSSAAWAAGSGAYRLEISGAAAVGTGSAFTGQADNPSAVYYNPAGMTQIKGNALSMGTALIQPHAVYKSNDGQETQMQAHNFVIPHAFFVSNLGTENWAVGVGALSSWGLGTEWNSDSFARYSATKSLIENKDYLITAAYQLNEHWSFAVSMDVDDSYVDKQKKIYQGDDANFRLRGDSQAMGYRLAGRYRLNDQHQFGLMYRSGMEHKYKGKITLEGLNNTYDAMATIPGTQTYQGIFGGSNYETDVICKSRLPDSVVFGYSFKPTSKWTFNADIEWMNWSVINKEELAYPSESDALRLAVLNDGNPASRDWMSVFSYAMGAQYDLSDRLRLRGGYYYHNSPIPGDTWEPNLPDADSHGVTAGFGYDLTKSMTFDFAWAGMYYESRVIDNTVADATAALTGGIDGTYRQLVNLLYATVTYKF